MQQRAREMKGDVTITSEKAAGTTVLLKIKPHD
jgi:signal transduction histidine kinase